ncbi:hypothetical protein HAZ28_002510 [Salmonella enterica]|nr:hypothetical protein [Salmonella enterica]EBY1952779.1 hypothetical protein [Salmonella enterica subsp. enterica serovar Sandiego]EBZ3774721.1 hypothetical protein [Salmonella enterica subsp. enterica serovar Minnesota]EBZ3811055.1 hypothetical protein [Salmonella enterica subsp. enterica serovar Minnesota]EEP1512067.1 hypothetical protein [Salmonella enterica]
MNREDIMFRIHYSYFIEEMHARLFNRLDRWISFILILLGSSVFASFGNPVYIGCIVAVLSAISFIWQFPRSAANCEHQAKVMKHLIHTADTIPDAELLIAFTDSQEGDSPTIGYLRDPAYKRALIATSHQDEASRISLSNCSKIISYLAGDCPES